MDNVIRSKVFIVYDNLYKTRCVINDNGHGSIILYPLCISDKPDEVHIERHCNWISQHIEDPSTLRDLDQILPVYRGKLERIVS